MKIINNTKNNKTKIDNLKIGELFLFNEKLYMKIAPDKLYYLIFAESKSYLVSDTLNDISQWIEELDDKKDLSHIPYDCGSNVFNLTDNRLEYLDDNTVTLVKGSLTIENV